MTADRAPSTDSYDEPMQPGTPAPATDELVERRIVTVLFADLVGFTTLSEQYDAEDVAAIQDSYFATVRETIGRYGGRLEKFIGDAAMAVFGVPRSRDDDAARAVRAGLALVYGIQQIGASLGLDEGELRLRVGVNTGEAVIATTGTDEGRVTGDTVNTAARLQAAAPVGGVLVGETTALAVADVADMESVPPLELKGKAEPTPARLVTGFRAEPSREQAMGALRAPTLGREGELATLFDAYSRTIAGGVERWLVVAPPGVGKSRLFREFADRLNSTGSLGSGRGTVVLRSRARADSVSPFDPVARLLLDALLTADRTAAEVRLRDAARAVGASEMRARVVADACLSVVWPEASGGEAGTPNEERDTLFAAWLEGLDALSGDATQVWLVEDVHWAGGDVLAFLDFAATGAPATARGGRLIVATARPSLLESNPEWAAEDPAAGRHTLQLGPLERTDAHALVTALVGEALPDDLVKRIAERSDGNCLFIEELLRTWVSVGTLAPGGNADGEQGQWRLTVATEEIPLPASVQSIYAAQLDDLPPAARRLARRASVAGRRFPVGALEPLGAEARGGLEPLRRRELLVGPMTEPLWGEAFAYRHALLRDAGYASLARAERGRLHVRLARWLEQAAGERSTEIAEQIAGHYSAALESAPALAREIDAGLDREAVSRLAAEWYERAGQGTLSLSAHDAARQLFRRSIDLTPDESSLEKARRWERLGDATAFAADMDEGAAAYKQAMELYRLAIDKGSAGFERGSDALTRASEELVRRAELMKQPSGEGAKAMADGAAELRRGSAQAGKADLESGLSQARSGLARTAASLADVMYQQLQFAESRDLATRVLDEIGIADPDSRARLLIAQAMGSIGADGPSAESEAQAEQAIELARQGGRAETELRASRALAMIHGDSGRDDPAEWQGIGDAALRLGEWGTAIAASINAASWRLDEHPEEVFDLVESARQTAVAHGRTEDVGWTNYLEAEAGFVSSDWDRATAAGRRAMDLGEANAYLRLTVRTIHVMVPIAAARGDRGMLERAARFYESLVGKFEFPDSPYSRVIRTAQDVELAAAGLREPFVPEVEPRLVSFEDDPSGPSWSAALDRVFRSWIEAGEVDGATRALDGMTAALPRFPKASALGLGTHLLMQGRLALARGERDGAEAAGRAALERFRTSNAPWWIAKAMRLLERAGAADEELVREVEEIEARLGAVGPTA